MTGLEHVEATLGLMLGAAEAIDKLAGVEEGWRAGALAKLGTTDALLRATTDRFFMKTKAAVPSARKAQELAEGLAAVLQEPAADPQRISNALAALERAVKILDERSLMQGFTVT